MSELFNKRIDGQSLSQLHNAVLASQKKPEMTPLHLRLLIHAYTSPEPYEPSSEVASQYQSELLESGLIRQSRETFRTTERGEAFVKCLLNHPLPEKVWINPNTQEVIK